MLCYGNIEKYFCDFLIVCLHNNCKGIQNEVGVPEKFVRTVISVCFPSKYLQTENYTREIVHLVINYYRIKNQ